VQSLSPKSQIALPQLNATNASTSSSWGACDFIGQDLSASCARLTGNYGRPYPRLGSLVGTRIAADGLSHYRTGVTLSVNFTDLTNMGLCSTSDALAKPEGVGCSQSLGSCSYTIGNDPAVWEQLCADLPPEDGAVWRPAVHAPYGNCQLMAKMTEAECIGVTGALWATGKSQPHPQAHSEPSPTMTTEYCTTRSLAIFLSHLSYF
jgi:hypothetical protein